MESETEICVHCKRSIPSTSIILHTAHCARFLEQCQKCKELVPKAEMLIHIEEYHSLKVCDICDASIEGKIEWDQHKASCDKPKQLSLIPCLYCLLECLPSNILEHEDVCGSRTEKCEFCNHYILVKVLESHMQLHTHSASGSRKRKHSVGAVGEDESTQYEEDALPCEFCGNLFPVSCLELHEIGCKFS